MVCLGAEWGRAGLGWGVVGSWVRRKVVMEAISCRAVKGAGSAEGWQGKAKGGGRWKGTESKMSVWEGDGWVWGGRRMGVGEEERGRPTRVRFGRSR